MSATIKYKGGTIAAMNTNTSKTLHTSGKYCEADIIVENVQDGGGGITPSGSITITENGTFDVSQFAEAVVNVGGGGLPAWIEEMEIVEYIPTSDTIETKTFQIDMQNAPDIVIVSSNITQKTANKQFIGLIEYKNLFGWSLSTTQDFTGTVYYTMFADYITTAGVSVGYSNNSGILSVSNKEIVMNTYYYAGAMVSWTAGATYKIIAIKTKAVTVA